LRQSGFGRFFATHHLLFRSIGIFLFFGDSLSQALFGKYLLILQAFREVLAIFPQFWHSHCFIYSPAAQSSPAQSDFFDEMKPTITSHLCA